MFVTAEYRNLLEAERMAMERLRASQDDGSFSRVALALRAIVAQKVEIRKVYRSNRTAKTIESAVVEEIPQIQAPPTENQETVTAPPTPQGEIGDGC